MTADELAIARAKRQRRACPDFDPQTHFAAVEHHMHTFIAAHRRAVARRGRLAELEFTVDCLTDPTGARSLETHLSAIANMLAVAVDMLARRKDAR